MFHVALVGLLFVLLLVWERRRTSPDPDVRARQRTAGSWPPPCVYGVAVANHSLALLLPPAIGLFVLAVAPRILLEWRLVLTLRRRPVRHGPSCSGWSCRSGRR